MPLFFLIPLCTGLITGYIFQKNTDEIACIAGVFKAVSFILSLVLAPWQIQFILLIFVLFVTKKILRDEEFPQTDGRRK
ncbi:hypothetical protein VB711_03055 [Cronbergia sp. UHCC 0137]|uniref:hypothetical protein n=1 Tax=Cronbergia sp. UHCC 0137 TaxID=3110239 RepID=UPI002B1F3F6C|nr:hypothetical protein [Cronbergia sp. UHCC 0137]MEA5616821.1 hypothetical protein [Cronbergia sp. UHCC 0137]